ncbi:hypothetical protein TVAG_014240 [Trichomonas vaginalis G3]|uniref:Uncharacterized protein n=1 Tax=Trichomonas vaginalis (strain ATCC PRA-98 / G3) TaxID=412133 RepID=A2DDH8_TRIV3|nr:hypothetical protein TVAGG3_0986010 [Trichomonas vaginalis G3]EAY21657.1 hypothetical protein TVAG_014240 [Trichomonas vaginalis G3]KAI5489668.1 hypothetical protein TVAGG3_0986010 [Trichomonas vaginalis G3]|eukprot:XP_001582643.1 hypothetical protein [Trichomonas vaginalis G3]
MFSRSRNAKPLRTASIKFVKGGENLDIANNIMNVENQFSKSPKPVRTRKSHTISNKRRSASIEKIFEKQKQVTTKLKEDLQKHLEELRYKEQVLRNNCPLSPSELPPPPPPPPTSPRKEYVLVTSRTKKESQTLMPVKKIDGTNYYVTIEDISNVKTGLRKVEKEPPTPKRKSDDDILDLLEDKLTQIRSNNLISDDECIEELSEESADW